MNVSKEDAQASLSSVQSAMDQTRKALTSSYVNPSLIMWGLIWIIAFTTAHFNLAYAYYIFIGMSIIGGVGTALICRVSHSKASVKDTSANPYASRITALWIFLCIYIIIWLFLFAPFTGIQCNAFICTTVMFTYIVMGLWFNNRFMIVLGLAITAATLVGYYLLRNYYCLWMALVGGGAIFGTGLYIKLRWR